MLRTEHLSNQMMSRDGGSRFGMRLIKTSFTKRTTNPILECLILSYQELFPKLINSARPYEKQALPDTRVQEMLSVSF